MAKQLTKAQEANLALKLVICLVLLAGQLEALIDEDLVQMTMQNTALSLATPCTAKSTLCYEQDCLVYRYALHTKHCVESFGKHLTKAQKANLAFKLVISLVLLTGQLEALIDEDLVQLAMPEQPEELLCILVAPLALHKGLVVELEAITPAHVYDS